VAARPSLDLSLLNAASTRTPLYIPMATIQPRRSDRSPRSSPRHGARSALNGL